MPTFPLRTHLPLFVLALGALWVALGYPALWGVPPSGVHLWRQADSASIAYNYALHGWQFWQPQLHQLFTSGDPHTVGEFPIWYYLASLFGAPERPPENALRSVHLFVFAVGLFALGRLTWRFTEDRWVALGLPLLVSTSPVVAYYAFNFLPNVPALGCALVGWWGGFSFLNTQQRWRLGLGMVAFLLAGLTKPTAAVSLIAILLTWGTSLFPGKNKKRPARHLWIGGTLVLLGLLAWNGYMAYYKALHHNTYFLAQTKPIWTAPWETITDTLSRIWHLWLPDYGHWSLHLSVLSAVVFIGWRLRNKRYRLFLGWLFLGVGAIALLFFRQLHHHDYYYVDLYVLPVAVLLFGLMAIPKRWRSHWLFRLLLVGLIVLNAYHARQIIAFRSAPGSKYMGRFNYDLHDRIPLQVFLDSIGIERNARIISLPDDSPNNTLYFLDRSGWTRFRAKPFTADTLQRRINMGAEYLIITRKEWLDEAAVQPFLTKPLGDFRGSVFVFRLK